MQTVEEGEGLIKEFSADLINKKSRSANHHRQGGGSKVGYGMLLEWNKT